MSHKLFLLVLIANATGIFRMVPAVLGVSLATVSAGLLAVNVLYLFVHRARVVSLLRESYLGPWLVVLLLWPLGTLLYAPSFQFRDVALVIYAFALFVGTAVYTSTLGMEATRKAIGVSLLIAIFGLVLSMLSPELFRQAALVAQRDKLDYAGRSFGFMLAPSRLALSMVLLYVGWFSLWKKKGTALEVVAILALGVLVLLTGSRAGVIVTVLVVTAGMAHALWRPTADRAATVRPFLLISLLVALVVAGATLGRMYVQSARTDANSRLIDRLSYLLRGRLSEGGIEDEKSVRARLGAQDRYWAWIVEKPVLGRGLGAESHYRQRGLAPKTAHSGLLQSALEFGLLYPLALLLLAVHMYRYPGRLQLEATCRTNCVLQLLIACAAWFVGTFGFLETRAIYVMLGMFFAAVYVPSCVPGRSERSGS